MFYRRVSLPLIIVNTLLTRKNVQNYRSITMNWLNINYLLYKYLKIIIMTSNYINESDKLNANYTVLCYSELKHCVYN